MLTEPQDCLLGGVYPQVAEAEKVLGGPKKMKSIVRRIEVLEKRLMPRPLTARDRELLARIEAGRERVRKMREEEGLPPDPDWGLPPKRIHTSHGSQLLMDILHEGRERAALRSLRDKKLRQSNPMLQEVINTERPALPTGK
jgi:hypothetical protein